MLGLMVMTAVASALPVDEDPDDVEIEAPLRVASLEVKRVRERHPLLPPMRLDLRATMRDGAIPSAAGEFGVQVHRTERWAFDVNTSWVGGRGLEIPGPRRTFQTLELTGQALYAVNRWVDVGPVAGVGYRMFRQDWTEIARQAVPMGGLRADVALFESRRFGVELTARAMAEASATRMVLETQQVVMLSPFEAQGGMRLVFGHGRVRE